MIKQLIAIIGFTAVAAFILQAQYVDINVYRLNECMKQGKTKIECEKIIQEEDIRQMAGGITGSGPSNISTTTTKKG